MPANASNLAATIVTRPLSLLSAFVHRAAENHTDAMSVLLESKCISQKQDCLIIWYLLRRRPRRYIKNKVALRLQGQTGFGGLFAFVSTDCSRL